MGSWFLDQGLNPGAGGSTESLPLGHQGSPSVPLLHTLLMENAGVISCKFQRTPLSKAATCVPGHHCPRVFISMNTCLGWKLEDSQKYKRRYLFV